MSSSSSSTGGSQRVHPFFKQVQQNIQEGRKRQKTMTVSQRALRDDLNIYKSEYSNLRKDELRAYYINERNIKFKTYGLPEQYALPLSMSQCGTMSNMKAELEKYYKKIYEEKNVNILNSAPFVGVESLNSRPMQTLLESRQKKSTKSSTPLCIEKRHNEKRRTQTKDATSVYLSLPEKTRVENMLTIRKDNVTMRKSIRCGCGHMFNPDTLNKYNVNRHLGLSNERKNTGTQHQKWLDSRLKKDDAALIAEILVAVESCQGEVKDYAASRKVFIFKKAWVYMKAGTPFNHITIHSEEGSEFCEEKPPTRMEIQWMKPAIAAFIRNRFKKDLGMDCLVSIIFDGTARQGDVQAVIFRYVFEGVNNVEVRQMLVGLSNFKRSVDGNRLAGEINRLCIVYNVKPENVLFAHHDRCSTNYKAIRTLKTLGNFCSLTSSPCISHGGNNTGNKSLVRGNFPLLQKFKKLMSGIVATKSGHALERFQEVCGERDVGGLGSIRWFVLYDWLFQKKRIGYAKIEEWARDLQDTGM